MRSTYLLSLSLPTERLLRSESLLIGAGDGDALSTEPKYHIRIREFHFLNYEAECRNEAMELDEGIQLECTTYRNNCNLHAL